MGERENLVAVVVAITVYMPPSMIHTREGMCRDCPKYLCHPSHIFR